MSRSTRSRRFPSIGASAVAAAVALLASTHEAEAAPRWVDRGITIPRYVFAGNVGLGVGHLGTPFNGLASSTGAGMNLEAGFGVSHSVDLGLRFGARFGQEAQNIGADQYGRTLWTETYGTNQSPFANPELRVRWSIYSGRVVEVGLDGRMYLPAEAGARFGLMAGVPLSFHLGDIVRIDTGLYVPIVFQNTVQSTLSVPGYFWFQVSDHVWLGPMVGGRLVNPGARGDFLLGFGMGYQVARAVDLKWQFFFPRVNDDNFRVFGAGFGLEFRINE